MTYQTENCNHAFSPSCIPNFLTIPSFCSCVKASSSKTRTPSRKRSNLSRRNTCTLVAKVGSSGRSSSGLVHGKPFSSSLDAVVISGVTEDASAAAAILWPNRRIYCGFCSIPTFHSLIQYCLIAMGTNWAITAKGKLQVMVVVIWSLADAAYCVDRR